MAFTPSESPNISIKEIDLAGVVPAVSTSTGAFVGAFNWGPVEQPVRVGNEAELVSNFGAPSLDAGANAQDFLAAAAFLKYSDNAYITRVVGDSDINAYNPEADSAAVVKNRSDWDTQKSGLAAGGHTFLAKYPGSVGNSLKVSICPHGWDSANLVGTFGDSAAVATISEVNPFDGWTYESYFDGRPGTSAYVAELSESSTAYDEVHVVVVDEDGVLTGTKGTVLETFPYVSLASDAKKSDGTSNFVLDVLNDRSSYVWAADLDNAISDRITSASQFTTFTEEYQFTSTSAAELTTIGSALTVVNNTSLDSGANTQLDIGDYQTGFDQYADEDTITVDFLVAPGLSGTNQTTIVNYLSAIAVSRKDCVVVASPARDDVVGINNPTTIVTNVIARANAYNASSYLIVDNNYVKVYDKYNDVYSFIPAAPMTAGVMAATDDVAAPWFSPAGSRRGQYFGVTSLAYNATKSQRDTLYKASVNPIVNLPGQGILLYGDKTKLGRPSAFDRINVRRLFLGIERAIKSAAQNVMFEFNDEFTRAEFVNVVEPFLREIKGRRGITDFRVVCDETNNTPSVIDSNQFVASVFVKPARSINYVTLNFVAVRTGVDFDEIVGTV
jgi:hypothetical protein